MIAAGPFPWFAIDERMTHPLEEPLEDVITKNPDCIMVESSGLSDPSSIRSIINSSRFKNKLSYCGTICLTDALRFKKVYSTARCVKKQICSSDIVLLNKTDKASREDIIKTENLIKNQNPNIKIHRTSFGNFIKEWIDGLTFDKDLKSNDIYSVTSPDISIQRFLIEVNEKITLKNILGFLKFIAEDTYRIKGFIKAENEIYLINCVGTVIEVKKYEDHNWEKLGKLIILSGEGLPIRTSLKKGIDKYKDFIKLIK